MDLRDLLLQPPHLIDEFEEVKGQGAESPIYRWSWSSISLTAGPMYGSLYLSDIFLSRCSRC